MSAPEAVASYPYTPPPWPVGFYEFPAIGEAIASCDDCRSWVVEILVVDGQVIAREWHAADCPILADDEAGG